MSLRFRWSEVLLKSSGGLLIFCLRVLLVVESCALKSPAVTVNLLLFFSIVFSFLCFGALLLGVQTFVIVTCS